MTEEKSDSAAGRYQFYAAQYARFGSALAAEVRREAYGEDLGQLGWRTANEQDEIVALVNPRLPFHVLDIACGSGGPSLAIVSRTGCRLTGVDIELAAIEEARRRASTARLSASAEFVVANCSSRLPFDENTFDLLVCVDAVLHFRDRFAAFVDWFRLLRPGGHLLFTDAGVLTGAASKQEIDIRASQGEFTFVPPGFNENAINRVGFHLSKCEDRTTAVADIARRFCSARQARSVGLQNEEGIDWFGRRQSFLSVTADLAATARLSRFLYIAEKPT